MRRPAREQMRQGFALFALLVITGLAIAGPTGLLAWSENQSALDQRKAQVALLEAKRNALRNRVDLLNPQSADPDLASELVRKNLGVLHADEIMITIEDED